MISKIPINGSFLKISIIFKKLFSIIYNLLKVWKTFTQVVFCYDALVIRANMLFLLLKNFKI